MSPQKLFSPVTVLHEIDFKRVTEHLCEPGLVDRNVQAHTETNFVSIESSPKSTQYSAVKPAPTTMFARYSPFSAFTVTPLPSVTSEIHA